MSWWGDVSVEEGRSLHVILGGLDLWITRTPSSWQFRAQRGPDRAIAAVHAGIPPRELPIEREVLATTTDGPLSLLPALPDRAVVVRPRAPLALPAEARAELYLGLPLWLRVADGRGRRVLFELPSLTLSDTWLGTPARGSLSYAHRAELARQRGDYAPSPARAELRVRLSNTSETPLTVERIAVPAPHLSLFSRAGTQLLATSIAISADPSGVTALDVATAPDPDDASAEGVVPARIPASTGLARIYEAVLG